MTKLDKEIQEGLYDPKQKVYRAFNTKAKLWVHWLGAGTKTEIVNRIKKYKAPKYVIAKVYDPKLSTSQNQFWPTDAEAKAWREGLKSKKNAVNPYPNKTLEYESWNEGRKTAGQKITIRDLAYDVPKRWYEAMVKGIKKSSDVRNPYAIVKSIWAKLSPSKRSEIARREAKGEVFRYDLPLPVDKPTRGTGTVRMVKPFKLAEVQVNLSIADYLTALKSGIFSKMKREDGTTALVARCKSPVKNVNIFVDKAGKK